MPSQVVEGVGCCCCCCCLVIKCVHVKPPVVHIIFLQSITWAPSWCRSIDHGVTQNPYERRFSPYEFNGG